jgi:hypothetical protein
MAVLEESQNAIDASGTLLGAASLGPLRRGTLSRRG